MPDLGDLVPLTVEVRDTAGALANAGAVTLTVTLPDGTTATPSVSSPSTGRYQADYAPPTAGRYVARWVATGLNASAHVETFDVRPGDPGYLLSLSAAKAALNIPATDLGDDEELRSMLEAVTAAVEDHRRETIVRRTVVEQLRPAPTRRLVLGHSPVISLTSIVRLFDGVTWTLPGDAVLVDAAAGVVASYGAVFSGDLTVTYVAGYQIVPANVTEAAKIILRHLWQTQQTPGMGPRVFGGGEDSAPVGLGFAIPNRAVELLGGRPPMIA